MSFAARCFLVAVVAAMGVPASAEAPTMLGVWKNWSAYQATTGDGKVCYALSRPTSSSPRVSRDPVYLLISVWPGRNVSDEVEVVPGYVYKDGAPAFAQVGKLKTELFTRNDGGAGAAWVKEPADESALTEAMRKGETVTVTGASVRGTRTKDTFSLRGLEAALDQVHAACAK